jgi:hypothetical protein
VRAEPRRPKSHQRHAASRAAAAHTDSTSPKGAAVRDWNETLGLTKKSIDVDNIIAQSNQEASARPICAHPQDRAPQRRNQRRRGPARWHRPGPIGPRWREIVLGRSRRRSQVNSMASDAQPLAPKPQLPTEARSWDHARKGPGGVGRPKQHQARSVPIACRRHLRLQSHGE